MARRFAESGLSRDQATGIAEATSDEIDASLPSKVDIDLAIERIKGELLQAIHPAERRLADQISGYVKWFVGICSCRPEFLPSSIGGL